MSAFLNKYEFCEIFVFPHSCRRAVGRSHDALFNPPGESRLTGKIDAVFTHYSLARSRKHRSAVILTTANDEMAPCRLLNVSQFPNGVILIETQPFRYSNGKQLKQYRNNGSSQTDRQTGAGC